MEILQTAQGTCYSLEIYRDKNLSKSFSHDQMAFLHSTFKPFVNNFGIHSSYELTKWALKYQQPDIPAQFVQANTRELVKRFPEIGWTHKEQSQKLGTLGKCVCSLCNGRVWTHGQTCDCVSVFAHDGTYRLQQKRTHASMIRACWPLPLVGNSWISHDFTAGLQKAVFGTADWRDDNSWTNKLKSSAQNLLKFCQINQTV